MFSSRHPCPRTHAYTTPPGSMLVVVMMIVVWGCLARKKIRGQKVEGNAEKNPELPKIPDNAWHVAGPLLEYSVKSDNVILVVLSSSSSTGAAHENEGLSADEEAEKG